MDSMPKIERDIPLQVGHHLPINQLLPYMDSMPKIERDIPLQVGQHLLFFGLFHPVEEIVFGFHASVELGGHRVTLGLQSDADLAEPINYYHIWTAFLK
jgi:hypothetical protein